MTCTGIMLTGIIAFLTAINLWIFYLNYRLSERTDKRKGIWDILSMYSKEDLRSGIRTLWDLCGRKDNKEDFIKEFLSDEAKNKKVCPMRRTVTNFWITFGTLLKHKMINRNIAHELWSRNEVGIVEEIIIPLEDAIAQSLNSPKLPTSHALYYFVDNKNKFFREGSK